VKTVWGRLKVAGNQPARKSWMWRGMIPFVRQSQKSTATLWIPEMSVTVNPIGPGVGEMHLAPLWPS
jgi:hypothetical protein